ncbi:hypothetical protein Y032_0026g1439 [Ancylostoma ceylanicum]|uniref:Uncharacterized protein n=1 Tax=Ancylostoma ceylanicum TaxID=53326 RepID=A0A016UTY6_9BILA|nr:hypothetical protein Y032_0026g1439 [Ancylostoma ceylanicum]
MLRDGITASDEISRPANFAPRALANNRPAVHEAWIDRWLVNGTPLCPQKFTGNACSREWMVGIVAQIVPWLGHLVKEVQGMKS